MQHVLKPALIAAAACGLAIAVSSPSQAQNARYVYPYPAQHYSIYQNPDGTYDSPTDLSRDVWGIPCGVECTREAQARWSHYIYRHRYGEYGAPYGE